MFLSVITVAFRNYEGVVKPALAAQPGARSEPHV